MVYKLTVLDDFSTGNLENVRANLNRGSFCFVKGDVQDRRAIREASKM
jgi:UDP-glucose 4-epimerase